MNLFRALLNNLNSAFAALGIFGDILAIIIAIICVPIIISIIIISKTFQFLKLFTYELHSCSGKVLYFITQSSLKWTYYRKLFWNFNNRLFDHFVLDNTTTKTIINKPNVSFIESILYTIFYSIWYLIILTSFLVSIFLSLYLTLSTINLLLTKLGITFLSSFLLNNTVMLIIEMRLIFVIAILFLCISRFFRLCLIFPKLDFEAFYNFKSPFWRYDGYEENDVTRVSYTSKHI